MKVQNPKFKFEDRVFTQWASVFGFGPWMWPEEFDPRLSPTGTWQIITKQFVEETNQEILNHFSETKDKVAVQCGGHAGVFPFLLSNMFKTVYTFEPDPVNFHCLVNNCQKENVIKIQAALSDQVGMRQFENTSGNTGQGRLKGDNNWPHLKIINTLNVLTITIDSLMLDQLDLLIIDTEGHSEQIIDGAIETLNRSNALIILEKHWKEDRKKRLSDKLGELGYQAYKETNYDLYYTKKTGAN
jgi:FkbM family methyltransferase